MSLEARTKREAEETEHQSRLEVQAMEAIRSVRVTDLRRAPVSASFGVLGPDGRAGS